MIICATKTQMRMLVTGQEKQKGSSEHVCVYRGKEKQEGSSEHVCVYRHLRAFNLCKKINLC